MKKFNNLSDDIWEETHIPAPFDLTVYNARFLSKKQLNYYIGAIGLRTISFKELPIKTNLYKDGESDNFIVYPVILFDDQPCILLRPCSEKWSREDGFKYDLEGSFRDEIDFDGHITNEMLNVSEYSKIHYIALFSDLENNTIEAEVKNNIIKWVDYIV